MKQEWRKTNMYSDCLGVSFNATINSVYVSNATNHSKKLTKLCLILLTKNKSIKERLKI